MDELGIDTLLPPTGDVGHHGTMTLRPGARRQPLGGDGEALGRWPVASSLLSTPLPDAMRDMHAHPPTLVMVTPHAQLRPVPTT